MIALYDLPPALVRTYGILLGLAGGSFLNVVIYRTPRGMSVARPASHCPACGAPVAQGPYATTAAGPVRCPPTPQPGVDTLRQ